jgi:hypothetical protein
MLSCNHLSAETTCPPPAGCARAPFDGRQRRSTVRRAATPRPRSTPCRQIALTPRRSRRRGSRSQLRSATPARSVHPQEGGSAALWARGGTSARRASSARIDLRWPAAARLGRPLRVVCEAVPEGREQSAGAGGLAASTAMKWAGSRRMIVAPRKEISEDARMAHQPVSRGMPPMRLR